MEFLEFMMQFLTTLGVAAITSIVIVFGTMALITVIGTPISNAIKSRKKRKQALNTIVNHDISRSNDEIKEGLESRLLQYYHKSEITPQLLQYIDKNYMKELQRVTHENMLQKQREQLNQQREQEISQEIQSLEKRQEAQLDAFSTVKELGENKQQEQA